MSEDSESKKFFDINQEMTFYSAVISHAYYSIFYCAKAILLTKNIKTDSPNIHKKTFDAFKTEFVDTGFLMSSFLRFTKRWFCVQTLFSKYSKMKNGKEDTSRIIQSLKPIKNLLKIQSKIQKCSFQTY